MMHYGKHPPQPSRPLRHPLSGAAGMGHRVAYTLVEVVISTVVVGTMLVAALHAVGAARGGLRQISDRSRGMLLAQDLMAEILARAYVDPNEQPICGVEPSELPQRRAACDDVDDYAVWSECPPCYADGTEMPGLAGWRRDVTVELVSPASLGPVPGSDELPTYDARRAAWGATDEQTILPLPENDPGIKRIRVTVYRNDVLVAELTALRTAGWSLPAVSGTTP